MVMILILLLSIGVCGGTASDGKNKVTSVSESGVCFYGKTAERVLSILATGKYRSLLHSDHKLKDCSDLNQGRDKTGVYTIYPDAGDGFKVFCDMDTDGGGWTILVRRADGSVDYNRKWKEYEDGFGNVQNEFWIGNRNIHRLTTIGNTKMRVDITNFKGERRFAKYSTFNVGNAASKYKLNVSGFTGNAGDAFEHQNGARFTTPDSDNDNEKTNCALRNGRVGSGWWFNACELVSFTLSYQNQKKGQTGDNLIQWQTWKESAHSIKFAKMMIRRI